MTGIVNPVKYPTKKALRAAVAVQPKLVYITDPSIIAPREFTAADMRPGQREVVTNHPKRSWFATIIRLGDGTFRVE